MHIPALFALTALALLATGCATVVPETGTTTGAMASTPAPIENYDWSFGSNGGEAGLVYGLVESDDVWLVMGCRRGSGRLELGRPAASGHPNLISVESGGEIGRYPAQSEPSELHDGIYLTGEANTQDPIFGKFRQTGWMIITGPGYRDAMVPHPESAPDIERFFAFCG